MTSLIFWSFLTYLPIYLVLLYNVPFWGYFGPPYLPLHGTSLMDVPYVETLDQNTKTYLMFVETKAGKDIALGKETLGRILLHQTYRVT